ncbi:MAG: BREX system ATP-binding domain-containing protein [Tepidiformaceae bacterium]
MPSIVGREEQLTRLTAGIEAVGDGGARLLTVTGAPGMGKTMLVRAAAEFGRANNCVVLEAAAGPECSAIPFAPAAGALRRVLSEHAEGRGLLQGVETDLAPLLPELLEQPGGPAWPEAELSRKSARALEAFCVILRRLAVEGPVLLLCDDLQWADRSTLQLFRWMLRQLADAPLLVVGTARTGAAPLGSELAALVAAGEEILVDRLDEMDSRRVLAAGLPAGFELSLEDATHAVHLAQGNPLYLVHAARALADGKPLAAFEHGVGRVLRARFTDLPPGARDVVSAGRSSANRSPLAGQRRWRACPCGLRTGVCGSRSRRGCWSKMASRRGWPSHTR